jgi:hypothetical protein
MKYILYILGFLLGIFILLSIMRFKYFYYKDGKDKDKDDDEEYYKLNIEGNLEDIKNNNNTIEKFNIIENYKNEEDNIKEYDDEDEANLFNCNENIIVKFKLSRLLDKKYLVILLSSYIKENYDKEKNVWKQDNVKSIHFNGGDITIDGVPEYILSRLNPLIGGYNINNSTINIFPVFKEMTLGAKWVIIERPAKDFIEIKSTDETAKRYDNLIKELGKGVDKYIPDTIINTFPKIEYNNYVKIDDVYYKPYIDDTTILKNVSILFNIKLNNINDNNGYLFYLSKKGEKDLASISIKIVDSNNIKINNITEECKDNIYCSKLISNIQESINIHNNYYENNSASNKEFNNFIEEQCNIILDKKEPTLKEGLKEGFETEANKEVKKDDVTNNPDGAKTGKLNVKLCEYIKNNLQDEYYYYNNIYKKKNYTIQLNINSKVYNIYNIGQDVFDTDNTFIGLIINDNDVIFHLNNTIYNFKRLDKENIVPTFPFIINKNKSNNMILYSFAIFKDIYCEADIISYKMYNNYYLNSINNLDETKNVVKK